MLPAVTVGNKFVMLEFKYANTLTLFQNGFAVAALGLGKWVGGFVEMKPFDTLQWKVFAVSAFFLAMQIITSLRALPLVAIATVVAFRNMCTLIVALIDYFVFKKAFSRTSVAALGASTIGMAIYASNDINFNAVGYMWLSVNAFATISNTFWNKVYITRYTREKKIQTSYGVAFICQTETLPLVLVMAMANHEGGALMELASLQPLSKIMVFITCCGGILISVAYPKCFSLMSGTSVVVASTANKAISIMLGVLIFGTTLTVTQVTGLVICVAGSLWYSVEGKRK